jgi:hypothetical protein
VGKLSLGKLAFGRLVGGRLVVGRVGIGQVVGGRLVGGRLVGGRVTVEPKICSKLPNLNFIYLPTLLKFNLNFPNLTWPNWPSPFGQILAEHVSQRKVIFKKVFLDLASGREFLRRNFLL